mgnify:FL=1
MIKNRIRQLREEQHISQVALSVRLEVSQETISAYELGKHYPTVAKLLQMAQLFHASTDYILGISDVRLPQTEAFTCIEEYQLLDLFRRLSPVQQQKALSYLDGLSDQNSISP